MNKINALYMILILFVCSCSSSRMYQLLDESDYLEEQLRYNYLHKKGEVYRLDIDYRIGIYLESYIRAYLQYPSDINLLIHAFDFEDFDYYSQKYHFQLRILTKYKNKLKIYSSDSTVAIFYKRIKPSRIVGFTKVPEMFNQDSDLSRKWLYYNNKGYIVRRDSLTQQYKAEILNIYKKHVDLKYVQNPEGKDLYQILEYIPTQVGLYDAITKELIPTDNSAFYHEIIEWMEKTCKENSYSRFIIPSLIPIRNQSKN